MPVEVGDVLNVPLAGMFFVDGAVKKPGSFALNRPYTLTQALAMAGGADDELADYGNVPFCAVEMGWRSKKLPLI